MPVTPAMQASMDLEAALRAGDLERARSALGDPAGFPNVRDPYLDTTVLAHALLHAPAATVASLLELGADPNLVADDGFPSVSSVIHHRADRDDRAEIVELLLNHGADPNVRGFNDWAPLHFAAVHGDSASVELLLAHGADPRQRTRIDDLSTAAEEAERCGYGELGARLRAAEET